jgi:prolyl oligopeptidase
MRKSGKPKGYVTKRPLGAAAGSLLLAAAVMAQPAGIAEPPNAPKRAVTDVYFGVSVTDDYRYMENLKDPEVQAWMRAQNAHTRAVLARLPGHSELLARINELYRSAPAFISRVRRLPGDVYFYRKELAGEDDRKLYVRTGLNGAERLLADPESMDLALKANAAKGKNAITFFVPSPDARYVAVGIAPGGSRMDSELHVIDTRTRQPTSDVITGGVTAAGLPPSWLPDSRGFVYGKLQRPAPGAPGSEGQKNFRSYLHLLGTDADRDPAVFGSGVVSSIPVDPEQVASVRIVTGAHLVLGVLNRDVESNSEFFVEPIENLNNANSRWLKVASLSDGVTGVALHGDSLYVLTHRDAPRYKIVRTSARHPDLASAATVLPASEGVVSEMAAAQDALYAVVLDGGASRLLRISYEAGATIEHVKLPRDGSIELASVDARVPGVLFTLSSWTRADAVLAYDPQLQRVVDTALQPLGSHDNPSGIYSTEVRVHSYDGTSVPLSIVARSGMQRDGSNPTWLAGYGAYGSSFAPFFWPAMLAWYERGGVFAVCHVRGGGEYGEEWHLAGKGPSKPNTWRDYIACAEYLTKERYTSPARLAGLGGSAGGIMIGRVITERPDLLAAAIGDVAITDLLRFETTANGQANIPEFGSVKTKEGFEALLAMSPYHHVVDHARYPAVLLDCGLNDDVVEPWHAAKLAARLQAATSSGNPVLLRIDDTGSHYVDSEARLHEKLADQLSFVMWRLGLLGAQPRPH